MRRVKKEQRVISLLLRLGRVVGFEPTISWATTRRVNPYTTPAITWQNSIIAEV